MENQHRKIKGYHELTKKEKEIALMNIVKEYVAVVDELVDELDTLDVDHRWIAIAKADLQKGFIALTRAITKPDSF